MTCKEYMKAIRDELNGSMGYYWKAKEAHKSGDSEAYTYIMKMANDEFEHAGALMKMMHKHIDSKTANEDYNGIYKSLYESSIEMLTDEYEETEKLLKSSK